MEFLPVVAMAALILKGIDFLRYLKAGDANGVFTQLTAWVGGILVVLLAAQTDWAAGILIGSMSLATLGFWSLIFYGMSAGSVASAAKDFSKSIDNSNTSAIPVLLPLSRTTGGQSAREVG